MVITVDYTFFFFIINRNRLVTVVRGDQPDISAGGHRRTISGGSQNRVARIRVNPSVQGEPKNVSRSGTRVRLLRVTALNTFVYKSVYGLRLAKTIPWPSVFGKGSHNRERHRRTANDAGRCGVSRQNEVEWPARASWRMWHTPRAKRAFVVMSERVMLLCTRTPQVCGCTSDTCTETGRVRADRTPEPYCVRQRARAVPHALHPYAPYARIIIVALYIRRYTALHFRGTRSRC